MYDRLSAPSLLELAPPTAELIDVGKAPGRVSRTQEEICALLVERGRTGAQVVRLKGGDPFVFARGGEEAQALLDAGVPFEVVPGVSSAIAVPAYAGIPVTMRYSSTSFTVVTGHEDPAKAGEVDWEAVARVGGTIVILMGVARLETIVGRLLAGGLSPDTPAAAIRWGTRPDQRTVRATLGTLAEHPLEPPATIVVGAVAGLDLGWFERRPLFGRRIVVTRARHQSPALATRLRELGAEPIEVPVIDVVDPEDGGRAMRDALARVFEYDWLVVTSPNGASRVLAALRDARELAPVRVAALGPGTAEALRAGNIVADLVPQRFVAEALLEVFPAPTTRDRGRVLLARAAVARDVLPDGLAALGWAVDVVDAYRTVGLPVDEGRRAAVAAADTITFTSSSTVERFVDALGADAVPPTVVCIGPVTAETARSHGIHVDAVASDHSLDGLVAELVRHAGAVGRPIT